MSISLASANLALVGTQDNATELYTGSLSWADVACGDGAWTAIDPTNSNIMWTGCTPGNSYVNRSSNGGSSFSNVSTGINTSDPVGFIPPPVMDMQNPSTLYFGTNKVYQTTSPTSPSWSAISPSLTTPSTSAHITAIAVSPVSSTNLFVGTSNNLVWYTTNTGGTWTQIISGLPPRYPTMVQGDPQTAGTFYVTFSGFSGFADALGHVFKCVTTSCSDISSNLPNTPANDIVIDPANPNSFYIATDTGVYMTTNAGGSWSTFSNGLPNVAVLSLKLHAASRTLRAATHGRSVWDISLANTQTLQTLTVNVAGAGTGAITSSPAGVDCPSSCATGFTMGTVVTLTATAATGSTFAGWSGNGACSGTGTCTLTMSAAQGVTATFSAGTSFPLTVTLAGAGSGTVTSSPAGINCPTTCSANFASGISVTLMETPASGSIFGGWSGACSGNGACSVTMSAAEAVTATFVPNGTVLPVVTSLLPASAVAGGSGFVLTVNGSNFVSGATVLWNGSSRNTTFLSGTQLQASVTTADIGAAGIAFVTVGNPSGGGSSNQENFDILETFSGTSGYLSMFVNGTNLGNSVLYQNNGLIGLNTTSPQAPLDVNGGARALSYQFNGNAAPPTDATATILNQANVGPVFSGLSFKVRTGASPAPVDALTVDLNQNVSITGNTSALAYKFTGNASPPTDATATIFNQANVGPVFSGLSFLVRTGVTPANALGVDLNQNVSIASCLKTFGGTVLAGTCSSDLRFKTGILPFAPVLDKLVKLEPVHFNWRTEEYPEYHFGGARSSGLIAQDVEKVFPEMVALDANGYKTVNYSELPYLTLAAIRELKTENDSLRAQLAAMEARLARLEKPTSRTAKKKTAVLPKPAAGTKAQY